MKVGTGQPFVNYGKCPSNVEMAVARPVNDDAPTASEAGRVAGVWQITQQKAA